MPPVDRAEANSVDLRVEHTMITSQNLDPRARGRSLVLLGTGLGVVRLPVRGSDGPGSWYP